MRMTILAGAAAAVALSAAMATGPASNIDPAAPPATNWPPAAIPPDAAQRLAGAIRMRTISAEDAADFDGAAFRALHEYLREAFPRVHAELRREVVAGHSLLYTWPGSDASLAPMLLMGHLDVVPVEATTEQKWQHNPFGGHIIDGFVWGRGAIDNKSTVVGTLEAIEMLLREGFRPARTVYLAYGHDEEVGGLDGAKQIADLLRQRGIELEMVLDEGGVIGDGLLPGVTGPVALVGIAEKGFLSIELSARVDGGHSSLPPRQGAIGILSAAIARLEASPLRARLDGPTRQMFDRIADRFPLVPRAMFANLWLTAPLVIRRLESNPATNAMMRTTTAVTVFQAGTKANVLPGAASAIVNFRIAPGDTISSVVAHVRRAIDDERVAIATAGRFTAEPSPVSDPRSRSFEMLAQSIRSVTPDAIVVPYLVVVATDARHYASLSKNVFRFLPLRVTGADLHRLHGIDERLGIREYEAAISTYRELIVRAAGGAPRRPAIASN